MWKRLGCLCILIPCLLFCGCVPERAFSLTNIDMFDTVTTVTLYGKDYTSASSVINGIFDELSVYDRLYDTFDTDDEYNNLRTVNDRAGEPVAVDKKVLDLLMFMQDAEELTAGSFNGCMGAVTTLWKTAQETGIPPTEAELAEAGRHISADALTVDLNSGTVCLTDTEARLDVGAVAKGYALNCLANELCDTDAVISIGGSVYVLGKERKVAIEQPIPGGGGTLLTLTLSNTGVVTSGSYQRYFEYEGVRYHHIIDPETLHPENEVLSVTVICPDAGLGDVLSTALFVTGMDGLQLVESLDDTEALWVLSDGTLQWSSGFAEYTVGGEEALRAAQVDAGALIQ